ncbi:MAG: hypothetical protein ACLR0U_23145 [Enterocloster clostridioformis]
MRDALKQLMYEGFLDYETNKGYSVSMLSPKDAYEIFFLRGNLENLALERCAGTSTERQYFSHGGCGAGHEGGCGRGRHGENHQV